MPRNPTRAVRVGPITIGGGGEASAVHAPGEWFINRNGTLGIKRALLIVLAQARTPIAS